MRSFASGGTRPGTKWRRFPRSAPQSSWGSPLDRAVLGEARELYHVGSLGDFGEGNGTIGIHCLRQDPIDRYRITVEIEGTPVGDDGNLDATVGGNREEGYLTGGERQERKEPAD
jgi:hypothetical protein